MYVCMDIYIASCSLFQIYTHMSACTHMHAWTPARKTHPSHMLTSLLPQFGRQPLDLARNDEVKTAFAEHAAKGGQAEQPSE
jgi:hypothetical protein